MPYLPEEIPNARVLLAVKAYPSPSKKYGELVCTAGMIEISGSSIHPRAHNSNFHFSRTTKRCATPERQYNACPSLDFTDL